MNIEQQSEAYDFFNSTAKAWQQKATSTSYNVIENRHAAVLEIMESFHGEPAILDVGCGTGQLVIEASKRGWKATGIDFSSEMIDLAEQNSSEVGSSAKFVCNSIFDFATKPGGYDVISAQGFIEYISLDQFDQFLDFALLSLNKGGSLALGSRNRLFNLQSLNEFTTLEIDLGTVNSLLEESCILQTSETQVEAISRLASLNLSYEQPTTHPRTEIEVGTRYQFSPGDLITRLARHGLMVNRICPINFHSLPISSLKIEDFQKIHNDLAQLASQNWINMHSLVPFCSSFVIEAKKA
jgi:2-polyprenyl-3-methyl-5-hydroxy-6-metoxy-1,4-benzoquinol methylase